MGSIETLPAPAQAARARAASLFEATYGCVPEVLVRAPGRVNLIGEHTDYNDGFVLPLALPHATWIAAKPRTDDDVNVVSEGFGSCTFSQAAPSRAETWDRYIQGVFWVLGDEDRPRASFDAAIATDIPTGASLSSSAAIEVGVIYLIDHLTGRDFSPATAARLGQRVENEWVGIPSGIMDQLISAGATAGHATLIDCRSLELTPYPVPAGATVVILDTMSRRELVDSEYANRRATCEEVAAVAGIDSLRDLTPEQLDRLELSDLQRRRARHVLAENARTLATAEAMSAGDAPTIGRLMNESHTSLRDDYDVSGPELDIMAEIAAAGPGCFGARMTGGGFAGCAVALVADAEVERFAQHVIEAFIDRTGVQPRLHHAQPPAPGVSLG